MGYSNIGSTGGGTPSPPNNIESFTIGTSQVNAYKVVYQQPNGTIQHASASNQSNSSVVGITLDSGVIGGSSRVVKFGNISNPSWNLTVGTRYYLSENGNLSITPATTGFVLEVGIAQKATELEIQNLDDVILIA